MIADNLIHIGKLIAVLISFVSNKPAFDYPSDLDGFFVILKLDPHYAVRITVTLKSLGGVLAKSAQVFQRVGRAIPTDLDR